MSEKIGDWDKKDAAESGESDGKDSEGVVMELWTRRPVCGARAVVIDRLSELRSKGVISKFVVRTWPDEIVLSEQTEHGRVLDAYEDFQRWAQMQGVRLTPSFERRTVSSLVSEDREVLRVPILCLAVYDDGLRGVYPCRNAERSVSVREFLDAFDAVRSEPVESGPTDTIQLAHSSVIE